MIAFKAIRERAARRKGGEGVLVKLLPEPADHEALRGTSGDRVLAEMTRRIFCSGFSWAVVRTKWPGFEEAFMEFSPRALIMQSDEYWDELTTDRRIVRYAAKIMAVRYNAQFVEDVATEHGSFGATLADWPGNDLVGLFALLAKRGKRLGGNTGRYFVRFIGKDTFLLTRDVVACLRDAGLEIDPKANSKRDQRLVQEQFNAWHQETGLPYAQISRICALSVGDNWRDHYADDLSQRGRYNKM
jgi:3-methyladenine DNA glycosylase Tag